MDPLTGVRGSVATRTPQYRVRGCLFGRFWTFAGPAHWCSRLGADAYSGV